nr:hypothetical protein [Tanacetum cinerariifolium]
MVTIMIIISCHCFGSSYSEFSRGSDTTYKPKDVRKNFGTPLIKDWISDSEDEVESKPKIEKKIVKPSFAKIEFVKSKEQVKSLRKTTINQINSGVKPPRVVPPIEAALKDSILQARNHVKEILLRLNLPDHRTLKDGGECTDSSCLKDL